MDIHLDWHFTHKRRVREGAGRVQSRSWFAMEDDWISSDTVDLSYDQAEGAAGTGAGPSKASAGVDRAELLKKKVVVPTDRTLADRPCPICKEKFKSQWNDADEEWVYYNAVEVDGAVSRCFSVKGLSACADGRLTLRVGFADRARDVLGGLGLAPGVPVEAGGRVQGLARDDAAAWEHPGLAGRERRQAQGRGARQRRGGGEEAEAGGVVDRAPCCHSLDIAFFLWWHRERCPYVACRNLTRCAVDVEAEVRAQRLGAGPLPCLPLLPTLAGSRVLFQSRFCSLVFGSACRNRTLLI